MTLTKAIRNYFLPTDIGKLKFIKYKIKGRLFNFGYEIFDMQGDGVALIFLVLFEKGYKLETYFDGNKRLFRSNWRFKRNSIKT